MLCASRRVIRRRRRWSSVALRRFIGLLSLHHCAGAWRTAMLHSTAKRGYDNMPIVRAGTVLLCTAAATTLAGCAGSRLSPDAPAGVNLAGAWKLNRAAGDDPQKVLDRMPPEAPRRMERRVTATARPQVRGGGPRTSRPKSCPRWISPACTTRPMKPRRGHCRPTTEPSRRMRRPAGCEFGRALRAAAGCALLLAGAAAARAQQPAPTADAGTPSSETEIVVEGRPEGPRMWRVRKGDHTMWMLGTVFPQPKKL